MPTSGPESAATLALAAILLAAALVFIVAAVLGVLKRLRRERASLAAIDFVRASFASRLARGEPLEELLRQIVEALRSSFALDFAELWVEEERGLERRASDPPREHARLALSSEEAAILATARVSGSAWARVWLPALLEEGPAGEFRVAPVAHGTELLGLIVVGRSRRAERLAAEVDLVLEELRREIAAGMHKARLDAALAQSLERLRRQADDLQASRARIVAAADAERRRIERDLHDGAQQHLVALAVKIGLIRQLTDREPERARALMEELRTDVDRAIEELRALAHGIYPPLLGSAGLRDALAAACRRAALPAELDAERLGRYRPDLEGAVYFCCLEALQNAAKHAGAGATARVRVWEGDGALRFEIADDGAGFVAEESRFGAGLRNMSDRLGAVGGTLRVTSAPTQGTRVEGWVPLPATEQTSAR